MNNRGGIDFRLARQQRTSSSTHFNTEYYAKIGLSVRQGAKPQAQAATPYESSFPLMFSMEEDMPESIFSKTVTASQQTITRPIVTNSTDTERLSEKENIAPEKIEKAQIPKDPQGKLTFFSRHDTFYDNVFIRSLLEFTLERDDKNFKKEISNLVENAFREITLNSKYGVPCNQNSINENLFKLLLNVQKDADAFLGIHEFCVNNLQKILDNNSLVIPLILFLNKSEHYHLKPYAKKLKNFAEWINKNSMAQIKSLIILIEEMPILFSSKICKDCSRKNTLSILESWSNSFESSLKNMLNNLLKQ